jgi:hypothetical protein
MEILDGMKESENGVFECYGENTIGHIIVIFENSLMKKH